MTTYLLNPTIWGKQENEFKKKNGFFVYEFYCEENIIINGELDSNWTAKAS